jgi:hypothetical protein
MRGLTIVTFVLAALLVVAHIGALASAGDPNGGAIIPLFFCGVPLAILVSIVSGIALKKTKAKRFWIPLGIGLLPVIGWPAIFVLESFKIIP